jgi:hypothetical protein
VRKRLGRDADAAEPKFLERGDHPRDDDEINLPREKQLDRLSQIFLQLHRNPRDSAQPGLT